MPQSLPTPDEIARRAAEVRAKWDEETRLARRTGEPLPADDQREQRHSASA